MPRYMTGFISGGAGKPFFIRGLAVEVQDIYFAIKEGEAWRDIEDVSEEYVWQEAPDRETALAQHGKKFDLWQTDNQGNGETKRTY